MTNLVNQNASSYSLIHQIGHKRKGEIQLTKADASISLQLSQLLFDSSYRCVYPI